MTIDADSNFHVACSAGRLDVVMRLLEAGADPNAAVEGRRPLNCVATTNAMTENHLAITLVLLQHGAVVDDSVFADHLAESCGTVLDAMFHDILKLAVLEGRNASYR